MKISSRAFNRMLAVIACLLVLAMALVPVSCVAWYICEQPFSKVAAPELNPPFFTRLYYGFGFLADRDDLVLAQSEKLTWEARCIFRPDSQCSDDYAQSHSDELVTVEKKDRVLLFSWIESFTCDGTQESLKVSFSFRYELDQRLFRCVGRTSSDSNDWYEGLAISKRDAKKDGLTKQNLRDEGTRRMTQTLEACVSALGESGDSDLFEGIEVKDNTGLGYAFGSNR